MLYHDTVLHAVESVYVIRTLMKHCGISNGAVYVYTLDRSRAKEMKNDVRRENLFDPMKASCCKMTCTYSLLQLTFGTWLIGRAGR